jgi:molybdopterin converting factor small subunit
MVYYINDCYEDMSMSIKMRIPIYYLHHTNNKVVVDVIGANVGECMQSLSEQFEGFKDIVTEGFYNVYMMDKYSAPVELYESVQDGDELVLVRGGT